MIVGSNGKPYEYVYMPPTPTPDTENSLRTVLKNMDALLDVKWMPVVYYNSRQKSWEGRYALTVDWPTADMRWSQVQSGEVSPADAFDIVGWLCVDMQDAKSLPTSIDGIENRVLALLHTMDNTRYPWKERFLAIIEKNKKQIENVKQEISDLEFNYKGELVP